MLTELKNKILAGGNITIEEAEKIVNHHDIDELCAAANEIREKMCGNNVDTCSIVNARSGKCTENCKWCAQSRHFHTGIEEYDIVDHDEMIEMAQHNDRRGIQRFSLVTSGRKVSKNDLRIFCDYYKELHEKTNLYLCASMGLLNKEELTMLKESGVKRYHCNLETSASNFSNLCTTHTPDDKKATIRAAQEIGMEVCSGGIIGMGETMKQRIEIVLLLILFIMPFRDCIARTFDIDTYNPKTDHVPISSVPIDTNYKPTIYNKPYSLTNTDYDKERLWINTAVLSGAFLGTLLVLECLPENATSWNREELRKVPLFRRWYNHVIEKGPEWDHDKFYFNYILHPYAGAVYFMSARSCGYNFYQSLLYCTCISTIGWEFGVEAFMERPSIQDIFITPLVGSIIGECFYKAKRSIIRNGYMLCGSRLLGNMLCYIMDPVNEIVGLIGGDQCRKYVKSKNNINLSSSLIIPSPNGLKCGLSISYRF